jgi:hypothetical protein
MTNQRWAFSQDSSIDSDVRLHYVGHVVHHGRQGLSSAVELLLAHFHRVILIAHATAAC